MNFQDKVVLISGATGGMGEALALRLAPSSKLGLLARREDQLKSITQEIEQKGGTCVYVPCDVKKPVDIKNAVALVNKQYGRIDVAILTAGILVPNPIQNFDSEIIKDTLDINFLGNVYFIEQLLPVMKKQGAGTIAVVSTLPDRRGVPGWGAYGASKAALSWLVESLRAEANQRYNIQMITIKPGSVQTPMIKDFPRHGAITPEKAADIIITGIQKGKKIIQFPFGQVLLTRLVDQLPASAYDGLPIDRLKGEGYPESEEK